MDPLEPSTALQERLATALPVSVAACFQCKKCSSGCPLTFAMDLLPDQVIRLALLGQEEQLLGCRTIWVCSSCETCTTRCPNGIDIAGIMDWLKEEASETGLRFPARRGPLPPDLPGNGAPGRRPPVGAAAAGRCIS